MLTLQKLKDMEPGEIIASGETVNAPEGVYMTDENRGKKLKWVARRGGIEDWAIYVHWSHFTLEYVLKSGQKVTDKNNIRKLVECDDEALKNYRY